MAYYFVKNPDPKKFNIVNHLVNKNGDIDISDNYYKLLERTDLSGNQKYAVKNNRSNFGNGENNNFHKLKENDIYEILKLIHNNHSDGFIAKRYNVNSETIRHIRIGKSWKTITHKILSTNYLEMNN